MNRHRPARAAAGVLALATLAALAGCASAATTVVVPFDERAADQLYVGDCFAGADLDSLAFDPSERVPCDEPHNVEIAALVDGFDGEPLPEPDVINGIFYPACHDAVQKVIAPPLEELPLITSYTGDLADDNTIDGPLVCVMYTRNGDILNDSVLVADPREMVGDWRLLSELEVGSCFRLGAQNNLGMPEPCDPGRLMYIGTIEATGDEFPGADELRLQRNAGCSRLVPDDDRIDPSTLSGTVPGEGEWILGLRDITCDVEVI